MDGVLQNLKLLRDDMSVKGWWVEAFDFTYKQKKYFALVRRYAKDEPKEPYALCCVEFLERGNLDHNLVVPANTRGLMTDAQTLREYFGIEWAENLGQILHQFTEQFAKFVPKEVAGNRTNEQKEAMVHSLSKSDSEDPTKIYCSHVRRNPVNSDGKLGRRSRFNDNKARLLRLDLYRKLHRDTNISFCFSANPEKESTDEEILEKMACE